MHVLRQAICAVAQPLGGEADVARQDLVVLVAHWRKVDLERQRALLASTAAVHSVAVDRHRHPCEHLVERSRLLHRVCLRCRWWHVGAGSASRGCRLPQLSVLGVQRLSHRHRARKLLIILAETLDLASQLRDQHLGVMLRLLQRRGHLCGVRLRLRLANAAQRLVARVQLVVLLGGGRQHHGRGCWDGDSLEDDGDGEEFQRTQPTDSKKKMGARREDEAMGILMLSVRRRWLGSVHA